LTGKTHQAKTAKAATKIVHHPNKFVAPPETRTQFWPEPNKTGPKSHNVKSIKQNMHCFAVIKIIITPTTRPPCLSFLNFLNFDRFSKYRANQQCIPPSLRAPAEKAPNSIDSSKPARCRHKVALSLTMASGTQLHLCCHHKHSLVVAHHYQLPYPQDQTFQRQTKHPETIMGGEVGNGTF
jgi:hypothetical protein